MVVAFVPDPDPPDPVPVVKEPKPETGILPASCPLTCQLMVLLARKADIGVQVNTLLLLFHAEVTK